MPEATDPRPNPDDVPLDPANLEHRYFEYLTSRGIHPDRQDPAKIAETLRAFMAGAGAVYQVLSHVGTHGTEAEKAAISGNLMEQVGKFWEEQAGVMNN